MVDVLIASGKLGRRTVGLGESSPSTFYASLEKWPPNAVQIASLQEGDLGSCDGSYTSSTPMGQAQMVKTI